MTARHRDSVQDQFSAALLRKPRNVVAVLKKIGEKNPIKPLGVDFDLSDPYQRLPDYNPLLDPHLKKHFSKPSVFTRLVRDGAITEDGCAVRYERLDHLLTNQSEGTNLTTPTRKTQHENESSRESVEMDIRNEENSPVDQRLQKVKNIMKKRQMEKEREQKRMRERLEAEKAARERIQIRLKHRREIQREKEREEAKFRLISRTRQSDEESRKRLKLTVHLRAVEEERRQKVEIMRQKAQQDKQQKAEEKFNATLEAARRTRIVDAEKQRKGDGIMSLKLEERRRNNRKQHDNFQEQQHKLKAANRQAELEGHRKRQLFLTNLDRKRIQHADVFREQHRLLLTECRSQPYFDRMQTSVIRYVERYREACGLPVAGGVFAVGNTQQPPTSIDTNRELKRNAPTMGSDQEPEPAANKTDEQRLMMDEYQGRDIESIAADLVRKSVRVAAINYIKSLL